MVALPADLFIVPTTNHNSIIYAPLRNAAFYAGTEATSIVDKYLQRGELPDESKGTTVYEYLQSLSQIEVEEPRIGSIPSISSGAIFILSQICNLACSYCYAQNSWSREILAIEKIKTVVDLACGDFTWKNKHFSFIGGGEPLATWDIFVWSVNYIRQQTEEKGFSCRIGLTTNGTLLNRDRVLFLKEKQVGVSISSDILPDVQEEQRPFVNKRISSYERVDGGIRLMLENGLVPRIRSTITDRNVKFMPQMVEFVIGNYPGVKVLHFEPVADAEGNSEAFYTSYVASFIRAREIARENGIILKNSITHSFGRNRARFCNGEFCVTPSSDLVLCHRISSDREISFESFRYGRITNQVEINPWSLANAQKLSETKNDQCQKCFAKWHCAGGCIMYRAIATEEMWLSYCKFVKSTITFLLEESVKE